MKTRVITGVLALPFLIAPIYFGGIILYVMIFLLSVIGTYELLRAYKVTNRGIYGIALITTLSYYLLLWFKGNDYLYLFITSFLLILLVYYVIAFPKLNFEAITVAFVAFFYITYLISHVIWIRESKDYGFALVWLVFLIGFGSDTFAYFSGRLFGKHKLAKVLSPKKTIEGSIGGIFGAMLLCFIYGLFMYKTGTFEDFSKLKFLILMGGAGSILSQVGDLVASAIKRQTGIKDFGKLLPGHGGILDRFDSNFFTAPFVYFIMTIFMS
ncbi:MAG: phosphatidate cytidylyltransferase [Firmicutes bacterium HGW-Firmicutes-1]|jgi:phosphatidate cytidylyltransferase|nr:MAG: phosphatidate cytidylyltransferase [Firmicutes bacterium HGW-Firmicutes-1]